MTTNNSVNLQTSDFEVTGNWSFNGGTFAITTPTAININSTSSGMNIESFDSLFISNPNCGLFLNADATVEISGTQVTVDNTLILPSLTDGVLSVTSGVIGSTNFSVNSPATVTIIAATDIDLTATGNVNITGTQVNLGSSSTVSTLVGTSFQVSTTASVVIDSPSAEFGNSVATIVQIGNNSASTTVAATTLELISTGTADLDCATSLTVGTSDALDASFGNLAAVVNLRADNLYVSSTAAISISAGGDTIIVLGTVSPAVSVPAIALPAGYAYLVVETSTNKVFQMS